MEICTSVKKFKKSIDSLVSYYQEVEKSHKESRENIEREKKEWHEEKEQITKTQLIGSHVKLDVGGNIFSTSLVTLTRFPDTMIGAMFSGRHTLNQTEDGCYFIDRDGTHFRHILNYLRDPENVLFQMSENERLELNREIIYYGLESQMLITANDEVVILDKGNRSIGQTRVLSQKHDLKWYLNGKVVIFCKHCKVGYCGDNHWRGVSNIDCGGKNMSLQPIPEGRCKSCRKICSLL